MPENHAIQRDAEYQSSAPCVGCQALRPRPWRQADCGLGVDYLQPGCLRRGAPRDEGGHGRRRR